MRTELRFVLAIILMIAVLVVTNLLFPPVPPEELAPGAPGDTVGAVTGTGADTVLPGAEPSVPGTLRIPETAGAAGEAAAPTAAPPAPAAAVPAPAVLEEDTVVVEGPLYRFAFSTRGARLLSARLLRFPSFTRPGPVELIQEESGGALGTRLVVGSDTLDLRSLPFEVTPAEGLALDTLSGPQTLRFTYRHPSGTFEFTLDYTFDPRRYVVKVEGRTVGVDRGVLLTELGTGLAFNEVRERDDVRASAYVVDPLREGIRARQLSKVRGVQVEEGPFVWAAFKSKYFVFALIAGADDESETYLGGLVAEEIGVENQARVTVTQAVTQGGRFGFRLFMGPQEYARLTALGIDLEDVNPYGWRFMRPVIRPVVAVIMTILVFLHENLKLGYGWVLILFGVLMRIVLFPLNQKAMRAQLRNMAVQPLLKEIQTKYKDNPEKLQKEMMKLYKEHGVNPLAGCLPMLLPMPILFTLFYVFRGTIELRGVPFLWLPDLSLKDPLYLIPLAMGLSMFVLQWIGQRGMEVNQQMRVMGYAMPVVFTFLFAGLPSGLNLYYTMSNLASLPQQLFLARERKAMRNKSAPPP